MQKKSAKSSKRGKVKAKGSVEVVEADDDANYTKRPRSKPRPQLYVVPGDWVLEESSNHGNANGSSSSERLNAPLVIDLPLTQNELRDRRHMLRTMKKLLRENWWTKK